MEEEKGAPTPVEAKEEDKKLIEEEIVSNWEEKVDSFDALGLKEELLRGIYGNGFTKPSPIQQKGILPILKKRDTIAQVFFNFVWALVELFHRLNQVLERLQLLPLLFFKRLTLILIKFKDLLSAQLENFLSKLPE